MIAEIICTGTELLLGQITNTNAQYLSRKLAEMGIDVYFQVAVGDNPQRLSQAFTQAMGRADLIIVSGGLGPTEDDLTKETLARLLGLEMIEHLETARAIRDFFANRGYRMPPSNLKQAMLPKGGFPVMNRVGTAPGVILEHDRWRFVLLPGPPRELVPMMEEGVIPYLRSLCQAQQTLRSRVLKVCGMGESAVEERIKDIIAEQLNPTVAPLAALGEVHLRITAKARDAEEAFAMISGVEERIRERLGEYIYGVDDETLEGVVGNLLTEKGLTIAVAESCTGGRLADRFTGVPGSSAYFHLGVVAYDNRWKVEFLGVEPAVLRKHGAVSAHVAEAMACGIRRRAGTDIGIGVTGIAGPGGGTPEKPVGLVYMALDHGGTPVVQRELFWGTRQEIKERAAQAALVMLRRHLLGL